VPVRGF
jgi:hypothetical protein